MEPIPINLAVEDTLSEAVLRKLLATTRRPFQIGICYQRQGSGYLKRTIRGFNNAAKGTPFLVLTDLDTTSCAPDLINDWLPVPKHPNLIFRVAVREVETWLMADRRAFAKFASVQEHLLPRDLEAISDAKKRLIQFVARSPSRSLREAIVPMPGSTARQGRDYNAPLIAFAQHQWSPQAAQDHSDSLRRALSRLRTFIPSY